MKHPALLFKAIAGIMLMSALAHGQESSPRGHLLIIGGGERTDDIMARFIQLAGGPVEAHIIVLPMASGTPDTSGMEQSEELRAKGAKDVEWIQITRKDSADASLLKRLDRATGIFFTGGDQVRITRAILGTPIHRKIRELYERGAVIGGTSAGAAIMSKVMLTGEELINRDSTKSFSTIMKGNVEAIEGLGFLSKVIIDQHFVKRKRLNRLISVLLEHPDLPAIGIDESTAIQVDPDGSAEVMGEGSVVVLDARKANDIAANARGNFRGRNVALHLYTPGERFMLLEPGHSLPEHR